MPYKHGMSGTPSFKSWRAMISRCYQKTNKHYKDYGERGITVCDKWLDFQGFYDDMGDRPNNMSLDRIDNNLGYSKENCRWADNIQQARNKRNNKLIEFNGQVKSVPEWAEIYKISLGALHRRLYSGMPIEKALLKQDLRSKKC